ncbi:MAG: ATP-binding protein [Terriglobia bacterium]
MAFWVLPFPVLNMGDDVSKSKTELLAELTSLRARLEVAEETVCAIRAGQVDAVLVSGPEGEQVFTLKGADHTYRILVEAMNEGAAIVARSGLIVYCNQRFSMLLGIPAEQLLGCAVQSLVSDADSGIFASLFDQALLGNAGSGEVRLQTPSGNGVPVRLSLGSIPSDRAVTMIAMDIREEKQREQLRIQAEQAAKNLSGRILSLQDEERRKIARELHDSLGQYLSSVKMSLDALHMKSAGTEKEELFDCVEMIDKSLSETRTLSHLLHPPLLDEVGFESAARWFAEGYAQRSKIAVGLDFQNLLGRFDQDTEIALFRILQEALTNVHRHSAARSVGIRMRSTSNHVELCITDDGFGINEERLRQFESTATGMGVGLSGMQQRVRQLQGDLKIRSDSSGTSIIATIPLVARDGSQIEGQAKLKDIAMAAKVTAAT